MTDLNKLFRFLLCYPVCVFVCSFGLVDHLLSGFQTVTNLFHGRFHLHVNNLYSSKKVPDYVISVLRARYSHP